MHTTMYADEETKYLTCIGFYPETHFSDKQVF